MNDTPQTEYIDRAVEMFRGQASMWPDETAAAARDEAKRTLAGRFVVPPFTVLDARQGYWRDRKRAWLALGLKSEIGRGEGLAYNIAVDGYAQRAAAEARVGRRLGFAEFMRDHHDASLAVPQTSVFDPVLCEIAYRWFCPPGSTILDPFAGGSVRGIVAAILGRPYVGIDLRAEQVTANYEQWFDIGTGNPNEPGPRWITSDSRNLPNVHTAPADFVFTCPPYFDLEVYSDDPADLSNADDYPTFLRAYQEIIAHSVAALRPDRFAAVVIGNIRDKRTGAMLDLVGDTVKMFEAAGARLYNESILVTSVASLSLRVTRQFNASRKMGKAHQQLLVFVKGDPRRAAAVCGPIEVLPGVDAAPGATEGAIGDAGW